MKSLGCGPTPCAGTLKTGGNPPQIGIFDARSFHALARLARERVRAYGAAAPHLFGDYENWHRNLNQLVHESDYERLQRPQKAKLTRMNQKEARRDIDFIAQLIDAIHHVVSTAL